MTNPFDDPDAAYLVVVNPEGAHSLWPAAHETPQGWEKAYGPEPRGRCLDFVERSWDDMRPETAGRR